MAQEYQAFPISNFRTGFNEALEPWLLPRDAYQVVINAHLYRGVLERIDGYLPYAKMSYRIEMVLSPVPDGVTTTFTGTLASAPTTSNFFGYATIVAGTSAEIFQYSSDASSTLINLIGSNGGTGTVNLSTLVVTLNCGTAPAAGTYSTVFFQYDSAPTTAQPIMGIHQYFHLNGSQDILVFDTLRMGKVFPSNGVIASQFGSNHAISEVPHDYMQATWITWSGSGPVTGVLDKGNIIPGTIVINQYSPAGVFNGTTTVDNGLGGLTGGGGSGFINYSTGAFSFNGSFGAGQLFTITYGIYGNTFSGTISDFFDVVNYNFQNTLLETTANTPTRSACAFITNNNDFIRYYDGSSLHYLPTYLTTKVISATSGVPNNLDISSCLHVFINREKLLLLSPTVLNIPEVNSIQWSTTGNPLIWTQNNNLSAPTSQPIRAIGFINSDLVVRFSGSERVFRYTGDAFSPFRWDSTNSIWDCDAPYSAINYDSWFSSVGKPAIVGSDGVNVKRADEQIPDFTDPDRLNLQIPVPYMNQENIAQCYGIRFDDIKEGWLCYNSVDTSQTQTTASDNVLAFNYLDDTYAIYSFPFSCLGFGRIINVPVWGNIFTPWENMDEAWGSYTLQNNALLDLGGDQYGNVFQLNSGNVQTVAGDPTATPTPVLMSVISKNFNPFIESGELARLGYVDLLVSADSDTTLRVQFYLNDQMYVDPSGDPAGFYQESILTFKTTDAMSPTTNQTKVWKRIYVGAVGKSHTIRFYQNSADFTVTNDQPIYIHAMVLYMKPAGRIFN